MNDDELAQLFADHKTILLEFHASWCEPCKWAEPVVKDIMHHFNESLYLHKLDVDLHPSISRDFRVLSVPTFILIKNGSEAWRMRGFEISPVMIRALEKLIS